MATKSIGVHPHRVAPVTCRAGGLPGIRGLSLSLQTLGVSGSMLPRNRASPAPATRRSSLVPQAVRSAVASWRQAGGWVRNTRSGQAADHRPRARRADHPA